MSSHNFPIVKITIDHMRHSLLAAMEAHTASLDEQIKQAVEDACKPERIASMLDTIAKQEIDRAIRQSMEKYFRYGDGAKAIEEVVIKNLRRDIEYEKQMNEE